MEEAEVAVAVLEEMVLLVVVVLDVVLTDQVVLVFLEKEIEVEMVVGLAIRQVTEMAAVVAVKVALVAMVLHEIKVVQAVTNEYETGSLQTYAYGGAGAPGGPNRTYGGPALSGSNKGWGGNGGTNASGSSGHAGVVVLRWSV